MAHPELQVDHGDQGTDQDQHAGWHEPHPGPADRLARLAWRVPAGGGPGSPRRPGWAGIAVGPAVGFGRCAEAAGVEAPGIEPARIEATRIEAAGVAAGLLGAEARAGPDVRGGAGPAEVPGRAGPPPVPGAEVVSGAMSWAASRLRRAATREPGRGESGGPG